MEREGRWCGQRGARKCRGEGTATALRALRLSMVDAAARRSSMARARASEKASKKARRGELGISTLSARKGQGTQQGGGALGLSVHGQGERKKMADAWTPPVRGAKGTFHAFVSCRFPQSGRQWHVRVEKVEAMVEREDELFWWLTGKLHLL